jgi:hypothetical protein
MEDPRVSSLDGYDDLARAVDARIGLLPATRAPGRMYAVLDDNDDADGFRLQLVDIGDPREIVAHPHIPLLACALAHSALGWSAPMPEPGEVFIRPSEHPQRRRAHTTTLVAGVGEVWSVVRIGDDAPQTWPDGVGLIPDGLRVAWVRHCVRLVHPSFAGRDPLSSPRRRARRATPRRAP